jgi:hypothetical protein
MTISVSSFMRRGYVPLACNRYAGIAWQGEYVPDLWMWNRQYTEYRGGVRHIQTVKVNDLKDAALRYWRDGWVPLKPVDGKLLRRMEEALRRHRGLKQEGVRFPDTPFLDAPEEIPLRHLGPETREFLGLKKARSKRLERRDELPAVVLESYRRTRGVGGARGASRAV